MEPTPSTSTPATPTPALGQSLVEYVRLNRQNAATGLLLLSLLFLVAGGWSGIKYRNLGAETSKEDKDKKEEKPPVDPFNPEAAPTKVSDPNRGTFIVGAIAAGLAFLVTATGGIWLIAHLPALGEAQQRSEIRALILTVGGLVGMVLVILGCAFFYAWTSSLNDWLDKGETKQARWVLIPLLLVATGAGIAFLAVQPARADERNNNNIRRLVYGTNLILSVLLLFVMLVAVNVALARHLPNKLDTTASGFYSLSSGTVELLTRLDQPATAYAILSGQSQASIDTHRLLETCADVPGTKFKVKFLSPTLNKGEISALKGRYPLLEVNDFGVLLTVGEDEKRHAFIREDEFVEQEKAPRGAPSSGRMFVGEARLMKELQFLSENQTKPIVYFTQSAGELDIQGSGGPENEVAKLNSANRLKAALERNYLEVRPLRFDPATPKVPDDATVVVIAEPRVPFTDPMADAIKRYMTQPLPDGRKGKLIVLSGAEFGPDRKVLRTGLEGALAEFGVQLPERVIYGQPRREFDTEESVVVFAPPAVSARNPVAVTLGEKAVFMAQYWRPVGRAAAQGTFKSTPLMMTIPGRATWYETERPTNIDRVFTELSERPEVRRAKELSESPRIVGVFVTEDALPGREGRPEQVGRIIVIGNGTMFSDAFGGQDGRDPVTYDLLGASIDWFRDRPSLGIGIEAKKYKTFTFPAVTDEARGLWLPLLFSLVVIGGAGAGVWVIRRS